MISVKNFSQVSDPGIAQKLHLLRLQMLRLQLFFGILTNQIINSIKN